MLTQDGVDEQLHVSETSIGRTPIPHILFLLVGKCGSAPILRGETRVIGFISGQHADVAQLARAPPCQGGCRGFESRRPLASHCQPSSSRTAWRSWFRPGHGGVAERRGSGLQSRIRGFESRPHLVAGFVLPLRAIGAAVARFPDTEEVTGSIPVSPTMWFFETTSCGRSSAG